ncbi:DHHA1 domain-containing protein [candidate division KSB1 bacterium]
MTERLYLNDAYTTEFTARIVTIREKDGRPAVILDRTCFYPTSGGQLHDTGLIHNIRILNVYEENDTVIHELEKKIETPGEVTCTIDRARRFDHMQQHTGQHILSQCLINTFNAETISSSLGQESSTIDINRTQFSIDDALRAEEEANNWIYKNVPVHILYPSDKELDAMPLRKRPPAGKRTRIVHIEGLDYSPCGGTHCSFTGETGIIKITGWEKMRGNIRLEFYCGSRGLIDYQNKSLTVNALKQVLTTEESALHETVQRLMAEHKESQKKSAELSSRLNEYRAMELIDRAERIEGIAVVVDIRESGTMQELQSSARSIRDKSTGIVLTAGAEDSTFVFTVSDGVNLNLQDILSTLRSDFEFKGGGGPTMVQGALQDKTGPEDFIAAAKRCIEEQLSS